MGFHGLARPTLVEAGLGWLLAWELTLGARDRTLRDLLRRSRFHFGGRSKLEELTSLFSLPFG